MQVWNVLHAARWKYRTQKMAKNSPSEQYRTICRAVSSHLRHCVDNWKLLNNNISSTCPHNMKNLGPPTAAICWPVWGTPANFNGFSILPSLLQRRCSSAVNQTLHNVWLSPALAHYIYISLAPHGIFPDAKFTLRQSLAFSYIGSVTAWHPSSGRQPNFAAWTAWYKEWNYGTFADGATYIRLCGHRAGNQPTF